MKIGTARRSSNCLSITFLPYIFLCISPQNIRARTRSTRNSCPAFTASFFANTHESSCDARFCTPQQCAVRRKRDEHNSCTLTLDYQMHLFPSMAKRAILLGIAPRVCCHRVIHRFCNGKYTHFMIKHRRFACWVSFSIPNAPVFMETALNLVWLFFLLFSFC